MRKQLFIISFFLISSTYLFSQHYQDFFTEKACRVDFHFCGNSSQTAVYVDHIKQEPVWGGRRNHLSTDLNLGDYRFRVVDSISNKTVFVDGFNALYREWQTTPEAKRVSKSYEQSVQFPFPQGAVRVIVEKRLDLNKWEELLNYPISPNDKLIKMIQPVKVPVKEILKNADPEKAVDIAVVAEGYSASEVKKFFKDAERLAENILTHEPFKRYKNRINVYAIAAPSAESGISIPNEDVWKNTAVASHFFTFYEPRYLTTASVFKVRDYAALVPYDAIYILANTANYGGGGLYNFYALTSADNKLATEVTVHEFGHSFAGLADEYFRENADVLDGMYDPKIEPWEPNITSLKQFEAKWKDMLPETIQVPTPVNDETKKQIGVFEGGGYLTKGMFRPAFDCRMRTNKAPEFCPVCQRAVERMILFLTE